VLLQNKNNSCQYGIQFNNERMMHFNSSQKATFYRVDVDYQNKISSAQQNLFKWSYQFLSQQKNNEFYRAVHKH
jgi:hypothetical protein